MKRRQADKMAIVMGDHLYNRDEGCTHFVILVDMVSSGGILRAFADDGEFFNQTEIPPSSTPIRIVITAPPHITTLHLTTPSGGSAYGKLDHRTSLGTIFFMSCDLLEADTRGSLWGRLNEELNAADAFDGRSLCMHIGDNVYADMCWNAAVRRRSRERMLGEYTHIYRTRYRHTWFSTRDRIETYAQASHLMILDDHEVTNNFMDREMRERDEVKYEAAMQAYVEYQQALLHTPIESSSERGWVRVIGKDMIITIDRCGGLRDMNDLVSMVASIVEKRCSSDVLVSTEDGIDTCMTNADEIKGVILVFSNAMIPCPRGSRRARWYTRLYGHRKFPSDEQLVVLYRYLFGLVARGISVLLVGGDMHFGLHATITDETGYWSFDVIVASPISNHPTRDRRRASRAFRNHMFRMKSGIAVITRTTQGKRCFAKVGVRDDGRSRYSIQMIYSQHRTPASRFNYLRTLVRMA